MIFEKIKKAWVVAPILIVLILLYGLTVGGPYTTLSAIFLVFLTIPSAVIFRYLDTRSLVEVEEIVIKNGVNLHTQFAVKIDSPGEYKCPDGRTFTPGDLYRDSLKKKKWLLYFLYGYRARAVLVFLNDSTTPVKYASSIVPGEILHIAKTTTILKSGLAQVWEGKTNVKILILIVLIVIAVLLGASWLQAGGHLPQIGGV